MIDPSSSEEEEEEDHGPLKGKGHTPKHHHQKHVSSGIAAPAQHGHPGAGGHPAEKHGAHNNREPHGRMGSSEVASSLDVPNNAVAR
jgi:hypothetical protein